MRPHFGPCVRLSVETTPTLGPAQHSAAVEDGFEAQNKIVLRWWIYACLGGIERFMEAISVQDHRHPEEGGGECLHACLHRYFGFADLVTKTQVPAFGEAMFPRPLCEVSAVVTMDSGRPSELSQQAQPPRNRLTCLVPRAV